MLYIACCKNSLNLSNLIKRNAKIFEDIFRILNINDVILIRVPKHSA